MASEEGGRDEGENKDKVVVIEIDSADPFPLSLFSSLFKSKSQLNFKQKQQVAGSHFLPLLPFSLSLSTGPTKIMITEQSKALKRQLVPNKWLHG